MSLTTWQTRLRRQDRIPVILVRIEPFFELSKHLDESMTWGTDATYTDVKTLTVSREFNNQPLPIRFVRVNGGEYQRVRDLAALHGTGNVRKWWYDRPSSTLNIRPSGAIATAGMDTTIVKCTTALYFSTMAKTIKGHTWLPRLPNDVALANLDISANDFKFSSFSISGGSFSLINGDGFFDGLHPDTLNFYQARITIWVGLDLPGNDMAGADYKKVRTCWLDDWVYDNDQKISVTFKQISAQTRDTATKVHHEPSDPDLDDDIPDEQRIAPNMELSQQGAVAPIIAGQGDTATDYEAQWNVATPTTFTDLGDGQGYGVECTVARKFINPESGDTHGLSGVVAAVVKRPGHIDSYDSTYWTYSPGDGTNTGIKFLKSPDVGQAVSIDTQVDSVRLITGGLVDHSGRFTGGTGGHANDEIDEVPHLIDFFWSHSGLLKREIWLPDVTKVGDTKTCTQLLLPAKTGDSTIIISDFEGVEPGYRLELESDDNSGDGYLVTAVEDDIVTIAPALASDHAAGVDVKCQGEYEETDWSDVCRLQVTKEKTNFEQVINEIAATSRDVTVAGNDGKMRLIQMDATPKGSNVILDDGMITDWTETYSRANISDRIVVEFGVVSATGAKRKARSSRRVTIGSTTHVFNRISFSHYGRETEDVVNACGKTPRKMKALANSLYTTRGRGVRLVSLTEKTGLALDVLPGETVVIYRQRSNTGPLKGVPFWVIKKSANYLTLTTQLDLMEAKE